MSNVHYIAHRINTVSALEEIPHEFGLEIDLRDRGERLILQHDPFTDGEDAEPFFARYKHGTLILNVKSERIEFRILELLQKYSIENYFFLDSSFPMIYQLIQRGETRSAVRFSEYESIDTVMKLEGLVDWVWVDCFSFLPISKDVHSHLKNCGFKLCLVSPELQGRPDDVTVYRDRLKEEGIIFDAICTKHYNIPKWQEAFP
jgi:hypothetical protein